MKTPTKVSQNEGSMSERKEDGMKVCRGPFNVNCTTCKDPQLVLFEMVKSLELHKITYKKVTIQINLFDIVWVIWIEMLEKYCQV